MSQLPFEQLKGYENKWVALLEPEQKIVGSGNDAVEATQDAKKHGYSQVTLFYIPRSDATLLDSAMVSNE
jgi:hypothetical protein